MVIKSLLRVQKRKKQSQRHRHRLLRWKISPVQKYQSLPLKELNVKTELHSLVIRPRAQARYRQSQHLLRNLHKQSHSKSALFRQQTHLGSSNHPKLRHQMPQQIRKSQPCLVKEASDCVQVRHHRQRPLKIGIFQANKANNQLKRLHQLQLNSRENQRKLRYSHLRLLLSRKFASLSHNWRRKMPQKSQQEVPVVPKERLGSSRKWLKKTSWSFLVRPLQRLRNCISNLGRLAR